jgi:hypothetical protein
MANFTTSCLVKLPISYKPVFFAHKSGKGRAARPSFWENNSTKMNNSYQSPTTLDILQQKSQRTRAFKATSGDNQPLPP